LRRALKGEIAEEREGKKSKQKGSSQRAKEKK